MMSLSRHPLERETVPGPTPVPAVARTVPSEPALVARDLSFAYGRGRGQGIHHVNLTVARGETVAVMGPNGSGKTTLLKVLAGVRPRSGGAVDVCPGAARRRGQVGYIPQQLGLVRTRSALENVLLGSLCRTGFARSLFGLYHPEEIAKAEALLARVGLADKTARRVGELSGGERQRVAIARTFLQRPDVLLADEFTSNLDIVKAGEILDVMREFTREGMGTVLVFHNVELAREYADRILFLREGRVAEVHDARTVTHEMARGLLS
ncbi:MAG TPA: ATP-binding cassette domain-containing protein [Candidatus Thermoplasmatota archaeon]|nr:ATP-binding cassette domain-containing protein [Candidatus Thermoplasmatota archaeon]